MTTEQGRARTAAARASRTRKKHDRWIAELSETGRLDPLIITALQNYGWMINNGEAELDAAAGTVWVRDGRYAVITLTVPGVTPATR